MSEKETRSFWGSVTRLLIGGAALAAVALFALYLSGLFGSPEIEPAVSEDALPPRPLLEADGGEHFPDAEFQVIIPLSEEESELSLYTVQQASLPDTVADARALGERFGLEAPTVYETPTDPGRWIVMGASGANISFRTDSAGLEGLYYSGLQPIAADGEPLAEAEAEAAAIAFLEGTGMLPEDYEIGLQPTVSPVRNVHVVPLLDGHPLVGNQIQIEVGVGPDGNVVHARLNPTNVELVGESVPVKSAAQAFDDLVEGSVTSLGYSFGSMPLTTGEQPQFFNPPPPVHEPGEEVDLAGWTNLLVPVAEGELQMTLHARSGGVYYLQGRATEELPESDSQQTLAIKGTIAQQLGPQKWLVNVSEIESQMGTAVQCQTGRITRDGDVVLQTDEGEHYSLAYPPEALESGSRAEVCADKFSDEQPVQWLHIVSPPTSEVVMAGGGGGSVGVAVEEIQDVEVTRVVSSESGAEEVSERVIPLPASPGSTGSGGGDSGGGVAIDPAEQRDSPYEIGDIDFDPAIPVIGRTEIGHGGLQGTLIVERAVLGYKYEPGAPSPPVPAGEEPVGVAEPVLLQPTWLFYGHTADGNTTFTIEVPAAEDSGGGRQ